MSAQSTLIAGLEGAGIVWLSARRGSGLTGFVAFKGRVCPVLIKDPAQPPSKRKLTPTESARKGELESVGAPYLIAETAEDVLRYFGLIKSPLEQRVLGLWAQGYRVDAIKTYREEAGVGLAEAKQAVMALVESSGTRP